MVMQYTTLKKHCTFCKAADCIKIRPVERTRLTTNELGIDMTTSSKTTLELHHPNIDNFKETDSDLKDLQEWFYYDNPQELEETTTQAYVSQIHQDDKNDTFKNC